MVGRVGDDEVDNMLQSNNNDKEFVLMRLRKRGEVDVRDKENKQKEKLAKTASASSVYEVW